MAGPATELGLDRSGNGNNFTVAGTLGSDQMVDTPTNNFCTLNPNDPSTGQTLSEGNLKTVLPDNKTSIASMMVSSGKWYFEVHQVNIGGVGIINSLAAMAGRGSSNNNGYGTYYNFSNFHGTIYYASSTDTTPSSGSNGDIVGCAFDLDNNKIYWHVNGTYISTSGGQQNPTNASNPIAISQVDAPEHNFAPAFGAYSTNPAFIVNFGQDSSFAGTKTAQGNQDSGGIGDFYYTPPTGFLALCTSNLPDAAVTPSEHFNTVLWSGDGGSQTISGVGFQTDFTWVKSRNSTNGHHLFDAVRGFGSAKSLSTNSTQEEGKYDASYGYISSPTSDGFTASAGSSGSQYSNDGSYTYVSWNWKANGSGSTNTAGSINTTATSANTAAGFSIITYGGNGTSGATIGHGLSKAPEFITVKRRSTAGDDWNSYYGDNTDFLRLNGTQATSDNAAIWNDTSPTSTLISLGNHAEVNSSGETYVAYAFHSVDGYSKIGTYTGNGSSDGTFVYTGFNVKWLLIKRTDSTSSWTILGNKRDTDIYNPITEYLAANASDAEGTHQHCDFVSNGIKFNGTGGDFNGSGGTYIFLAFAETPFKYSNAR